MNTKKYFIGKEESLKLFKEIIYNRGTYKGTFLLIDEERINSFYPNQLTQKEYYLLKDIYNRQEKATHISEYSINEIESAAFIIHRSCWETNYSQYMDLLNDLAEEQKIEIFDDGKSHQKVIIKLTTKGIKTVEEGEKNMEKSNSGNITNYGNMVVNSNLTNSVIGNGNSSSNFDYQGLNTIIDEIEKVYKSESSFSKEAIDQISSDIEEIKNAIQKKNLPVIQKCLNNIKGFVTNVSAGIIASGIWTKIQPFIMQIPGM